MLEDSVRLDDGASLDAALHETASDPRAYLLRFYPNAPVPPLDDVADEVPHLLARVQEGLWVAPCDCGGDPSASSGGTGPTGGVVWLDLPQVWCPACGNALADGCWRRVLLPSERERAAIEAVLMCRPRPETRNWRPGETLAELVAENVEHGDPVPGEV